MKRLLKLAALLGCFAGGLMGIAGVLGRVEPFAEFPSLREKLAHWRARQAEFDTIFVGTSRTFRGVMPSVFDRVTVEAGVPARSFNFGLDGLFAPEDAFVIEQIFRERPRHLRWLLIEVSAFRGGFEGRSPENVRSVYWRDWPRTWLCIRERMWGKGRRMKWEKLFESDDDKPARASEVLLNVEVFFTRSLNIGRGSDAWRRIALQRPVERGELGPRADGFSPMPARIVMSASEVVRFDREVAERRQSPALIEPMPPHAQSSLDRVRELADEHGVQVILMLAPTTAETTRRPDPAAGVETFDFRDVVKYPELFDTGFRSDRTHMNAKGAELFSRRIAERFIEYTRLQSASQR